MGKTLFIKRKDTVTCTCRVRKVTVRTRSLERVFLLAVIRNLQPNKTYACMTRADCIGPFYLLSLNYLYYS